MPSRSSSPTATHHLISSERPVEEEEEEEEEDEGTPLSPSSPTSSTATLASLALSPGFHSQDPPAKPHLSLLPSLALILSLQIGSGIFSAPSQVSLHVPSPLIGISVWLVAGLLVWTGASTFVELGLHIPRNGGVQEYLAAAWGEWLGFEFALVYWLVAKPAANAVVASVGAEYVLGAILGGGKVNVWAVKVAALVGLWVVTGINCLGAKTGSKVANGFVVLKVGVVVSIVVAGIVMMANGRAEGVNGEVGKGWLDLRPLKGESEVEEGLWFWVGEFVIAIYGGLWCLGGWETISFVIGEMTNPRRDLPRAITIAMTTVTIGFALLNGAVYAVLPMDVVREKVAFIVEFGTSVFGISGAIAYSVLVSIAAWGALNANIFTLGRIGIVASQRDYLPSILGKNTHYRPGSTESEYYESRLHFLPGPFLSVIKSFAGFTAHLRLVQGVPIYALMLNSVIASLFIMMGTFYGLIKFIGIIEYTFFFLATAGVFRIRRTLSPKAEAPELTYRTWSGNPIIFCSLSAVIVIKGMVQDPLQAVLVILAFLTGLGLWRVRKKKIEASKDLTEDSIAVDDTAVGYH